MAAPILCYPNFADAPGGTIPGALLTGGSWQMSLANLQTQRYRQRARSVNAQAASTWFDVTIDGFAEIRVIALGDHNLSVTARVRITGWYPEESYEQPSYQATIDVYPIVGFTEDIPFEQENWWDCRPLERDLQGLRRNVIHVLPEPAYMPNWRVEIFDEANPAGYVEAGRLFMATGWQPSQHMERGPTLRYEDTTGVEVALSGRETFDKRPIFRVWNVAFRTIDAQEALDRALGLQRKAGISGELLWIFDPDDAHNMLVTSFFARFRTLTDYELVLFSRANIGFQLKERL